MKGRLRARRGVITAFTLAAGSALVLPACEVLLDTGGITERSDESDATTEDATSDGSDTDHVDDAPIDTRADDAEDGALPKDGAPDAASDTEAEAQARDSSDDAPDSDASLDGGSLDDAHVDAPPDATQDGSTCINTCTNNATQCGPGGVQTCELDGGCTHWVTTTTCFDGGCAGTDAGVLACCSNACTAGESQCTSSTTASTCAGPLYGCTSWVSSTCAARSICEGAGLAGACVDIDWAEWPVPSSPGDVSRGAANPQSYTDNGDGTVTDKVTSLVWQQTVPATTYTWGDASTQGTAQHYCATLSLAGHADWRLPSAIELGSIANIDNHDPAIDVTEFPNTPSTYFWTSTERASSPGRGMAVNFSQGGTDNYAATNAYNVRCVR